MSNTGKGGPIEFSFVGGHRFNTNFRNEVSQTSGTNASQINQIQAQLAGLKLDYDKVSADLISTRNERDSTVSEMRQEIERLNLLHGDQRLAKFKRSESKRHSVTLKVGWLLQKLSWPRSVKIIASRLVAWKIQLKEFPKS